MGDRCGEGLDHIVGPPPQKTFEKQAKKAPNIEKGCTLPPGLEWVVLPTTPVQWPTPRSPMCDDSQRLARS